MEAPYAKPIELNRKNYHLTLPKDNGKIIKGTGDKTGKGTKQKRGQSAEKIRGGIHVRNAETEESTPAWNRDEQQNL